MESLKCSFDVIKSRLYGIRLGLQLLVGLLHELSGLSQLGSSFGNPHEVSLRLA